MTICLSEVVQIEKTKAQVHRYVCLHCTPFKQYKVEPNVRKSHDLIEYFETTITRDIEHNVLDLSTQMGRGPH